VPVFDAGRVQWLTPARAGTVVFIASADDLRHPAGALAVTHVARIPFAAFGTVLGGRTPTEPPLPSLAPSALLIGVGLATLALLIGVGLATSALLIGVGRVRRRRPARDAPNPAPARRSGQQIREQAAEDGVWPEVGPEALLVIIAAGVAPAFTWKPVLHWLAAQVCGTGDCRSWSMPLIGWAVIALPVLMMASFYLVATPSRLAAWGLVVSFSLLVFDLITAIIVEHATDDPRWYDFFDTYPGLFELLIGFWCAFGGFLLVGSFALIGKGSQRLRFHGAPSALPLLVIAGGQLLALPFALWFGRPLR
jgi:hypothetical protein